MNIQFSVLSVSNIFGVYFWMRTESRKKIQVLSRLSTYRLRWLENLDSKCIRLVFHSFHPYAKQQCVLCVWQGWKIVNIVFCLFSCVWFLSHRVSIWWYRVWMRSNRCILFGIYLSTSHLLWWHSIWVLWKGAGWRRIYSKQKNPCVFIVAVYSQLNVTVFFSISNNNWQRLAEKILLFSVVVYFIVCVLW